VLRLSGNRPEVVESVPVGKLMLDGDRLLPLDGGVVAARKKMLFNGVVVASLALDKQGKLLGTPQISAPGLFESSDPEPALLAESVSRALVELSGPIRRDDDAMREATRTALRRAINKRLKKRPTIEVHLLRV